MKNATAAYQWYHKAAEQGLAQAEYRFVCRNTPAYPLAELLQALTDEVAEAPADTAIAAWRTELGDVEGPTRLVDALIAAAVVIGLPALDGVLR